MKKEKKLFFDHHKGVDDTKKSNVSKEMTDSESLSRRTFLKKSAYSAPVVIALGQLVKPSSANAANSVPAPPPVW